MPVIGSATPIIYDESLKANPASNLGGMGGIFGEMPSDNSVDAVVGTSYDVGPTNVIDNYASGASLSQLINANPNLSYEEYMKEMAKHSDEWAEKLIDYYVEKASIDEQNAYTASREDTAYQRLVEDLKKAGLNPAMMYGSTASTSASGSVGHLGMSEGATYRGVGSTSKIKQLLLAMVALQWQIEHEGTQDKLSGLNTIAKFLIPMLGAL